MVSLEIFLEIVIIVELLIIAIIGGRKLTAIEDLADVVAATMDSMNRAATKLQELVTALANASGEAEIAALNEKIAAQTTALTAAKDALNGVIG